MNDYPVIDCDGHVEEMNVDVESTRLETQSINLGLPTRAWQFTTMGNERDRPSLSLPYAQTAVTMLEIFGCVSSRRICARVSIGPTRECKSPTRRFIFSVVRRS